METEIEALIEGGGVIIDAAHDTAKGNDKSESSNGGDDNFDDERGKETFAVWRRFSSDLVEIVLIIHMLSLTNMG